MVIFILVSEWVHLCSSLAVVLFLSPGEFCLTLCTLVFSQRYKKTLCWFLELFLLWAALFLSSALKIPDTFVFLIRLLNSLKLPCCYVWQCSPQWSGEGPQRELQGSYRVYLLCFPFFSGCRPNLSVVQCLITVLYCCLVSDNSVEFSPLSSYWKRVNLILVLQHARQKNQLY